MKANTRGILERCIEDGIANGIRRAYKYTEKPSEDTIIDNISAAIWLEIDCYFDFEND